MTAAQGSTSCSPVFIETTNTEHIAQMEPHEVKALDTTMLRSVQTSTRASRLRINTNRTRPYHALSTRPNALRKLSTPCRYFLSGNCTASDTCRYQHVLAPLADETEELEQELLAFVADDRPASPAQAEEINTSPEESSPFPTSASSTSVTEDAVFEGDVESDDEELYEVIPHPDACVSEVRYYSIVNPNQSRTYFVAQRQPVVEYERKNVGILSGGVLLGVPGAREQVDTTATKAANHEVSDGATGSEIASSSPSAVSNDSDVELWRGPVNFDEVAVAERLVWADEEFAQMEGVEPTLDTYTPPLVPVDMLPTPPPVIRRIMRITDGHNRRHSLS